MLKGCKKNVIYIKNTGSEMFEEAYFIVSDSEVACKSSDCDILTEANKIISSGPFGSYFGSDARKRRSKREMGKVGYFLLGVTVTVILNAVICFII